MQGQYEQQNIEYINNDNNSYLMLIHWSLKHNKNRQR